MKPPRKPSGVTARLPPSARAAGPRGLALRCAPFRPRACSRLSQNLRSLLAPQPVQSSCLRLQCARGRVALAIRAQTLAGTRLDTEQTLQKSREGHVQGWGRQVPAGGPGADLAPTDRESGGESGANSVDQISHSVASSRSKAAAEAGRCFGLKWQHH